MLQRVRKALTSWAFPFVLLLALVSATLAYQFDTVYSVDVGSYYDRVYLEGFYAPEVGKEQEQFRWTAAAATVRLPGLGVRGRWLSLRLHGWRPAGQPSPELRIHVNGHLLTKPLLVGPSWQEVRFWIAPQIAGSGSLRIRLESDTFVPAQSGSGTDLRELGIAVDQVSLGSPETGFAPAWPALDQVAWVLLCAVGIYLGLAIVLLPPPWAALVSGLASAGLGWVLADRRLWTTIYTPRLAIVSLLGLLLLPALRWLFGRFFVWGKVQVEERDMRLLLAIFLVGFWLKAGGLLYPFSIAIDLKWHLDKALGVVDGNLAEIYRPGGLLFRIMSKEQAGDLVSAIPYPPFYHITAAAFFFLPWPPYATANVLSVLLDTTRCFLVYFLACRLGLSRRAGLLASLLYATMPATFLLHSWGNIPTTTSFWWALASICYLVGAWERLNKPRTWAGLTVLLLGTMLCYSVTAALIAVFLGILLLGLWVDGRRLSPRPWRPILLALVAAIALATAIYYGQYLRPLIGAFLPHPGTPLSPGATSLVVQRLSFLAHLRNVLLLMASLSYGLLLPLLLTVAGLVVGWRRYRQPLLRWLMIAWFGTGFLFFLLDYRVDLVAKYLFFVMPALAIGAAIALDWLWQRWPAGRVLVVASYLFLAVASLQTWIHRLSTVTQDWTTIDPRIIGEGMARLGALACRTPVLWKALCVLAGGFSPWRT